MRQFSFQILIFFFFLLGISHLAQAQRKEKLKYKAEHGMVVRDKAGSYEKLWENVTFSQKNTIIYCDSAVMLKSSNSMEAFGHVRIVDNDTVTISGNKLFYDGNTRKAQMRENVVYTSGENRLYTDFLDYELDTRVANYFNNGKLVDLNNTLSSRRGYFYGFEDRATFYGKVELLSPEYTLHSDTLRYNTITKIAITDGRTEIVTSDSTMLYSKGGEFKTIPEQSSFIKGQIDTRDYILEGDELFFDDINKYYTATGHVKMTAKNNDVIITGEKGVYWRNKGLSKVFGNPVMKKMMQADTFYLAADTLISIEDNVDSLKRILAYNHVRMFRSNLQGKADSLAYFIADSVITYYFDPVLWNFKNQIESDTISLYLKNNVVDEMYMQKDAFIVSQDTLKQFNQVKGRNMRAYFADNAIKRVDVNGNGESIYFVLSDGDSLLMGMNRILCSNITMRFKGNDLNNISFYMKPEATFYPPHEITPELTKLDGFVWRVSERPTLQQVLSPVPPEEIATDSLGNPIKKPLLPKPVQKSGVSTTSSSAKGAAGGSPNKTTGTPPSKTAVPTKKPNLNGTSGVKKKENSQQ
jgi:lipopolysaccharide export system protein LptA